MGLVLMVVFGYLLFVDIAVFWFGLWVGFDCLGGIVGLDLYRLL